MVYIGNIFLLANTRRAYIAIMNRKELTVLHSHDRIFLDIAFCFEIYSGYYVKESDVSFVNTFWIENFFFTRRMFVFGVRSRESRIICELITFLLIDDQIKQWTQSSLENKQKAIKHLHEAKETNTLNDCNVRWYINFYRKKSVKSWRLCMYPKRCTTY